MAPAKKNEKSAVGEDFAEIRGYIADIRGSIAGIHEKLELLDLIAQKILGEDTGKKIGDVKKQQEHETMAFEDNDGFLKNMGQIQPITMPEKKPEGEEIHTSEEAESVFGGSRKGVDQIMCLGQWVMTTEATTVAEEEEPREHNQTLKKKKKRWKKYLLKIWKFLVVNRRHGKKENTSMSCGNEWSGFDNTETKVTHQLEREKLREARSDGYAYHVLDKMLLRRKLVTEKNKRKKKKTKVTNKKKKRTRLKEYLAIRHFSVEGQLESKAVLFVPKGAPFDPFDTGKKPNNIKLDVRRIFIIDSSEETIFEHLSFVEGMVYAEELPLNISKETLKQNKLIRKNHGKKCRELFLEIAETKEDYNGCYETFSKNLKVRIHEYSQNRTKISELPCYNSTKSSDELTSIMDCLTRMEEDYHWLVTNPEFDRGLLLMFKKGRNKTKMGCAGKGLKHDKKVYQRTYDKLSWKYKSDMKQFVKWKGCRFKLKHYMVKKNIMEMLSCNQIDCLGNSKLDHVLFRKIFSRWCKRKRGRERIYLGHEKLPQVLKRAFKVVKGSASSASGNSDELAKFSPGLYGQLPISVVPDQNTTLSGNDGFDMACSTRYRSETPGQFKQTEEAAKKVELDTLVAIVGDNVNANAYLLAENFKPCKIYSEMMGNVMMDARSGRVVDESRLWKGVTEQSLKLFDPLPEAIQEQLMLEREPDETLKDIEVGWWKQHTMGSSTTRRGNLEAVRDLQEENTRTLLLLIEKWISDWCVPAVLASDARCSSYQAILIWTVLGSGKAAWNNNIFSMTLGTRSVLMGPVLIRYGPIPKEKKQAHRDM